MQSNKSSRTLPELLLSRLIGKEIVRSDLPGHPDFVFPRKKVVVFMHGCFWHRCPVCDFSLPKSNRPYWAAKFESNKERDRSVKQRLESMGWRVVEVWEHELREDPIGVRNSVLAMRSPVIQKTRT